MSIDLARALADTSKLSRFDGRDVLRTTIAITNAGDGLSEAMAVDPRELHLGERVRVVLDCEVAKVRFDPIKGTDALARVHVLRAGDATIVDDDLVEEHLRVQRERIAVAKEQAAGIVRLPGVDEAPGSEEDRLANEHVNGEHVDLVDGCPDCDNEAAAVAEEKR